jgi:uncharacterized protein (DUF433 family)
MNPGHSALLSHGLEAPVLPWGITSTFARGFLDSRLATPSHSVIAIYLVSLQSGQPSGSRMRTDQDQPADRTREPGGGMIINRGRGPEIAGTRITIYRIMDFLKYNYSIPDIARELGLATEQVYAAIEYIDAHRAEADREYGLIMDRMNQPNPPEVDRGRAKTREELRERIRARLERKGARDHTVGQ